MVTSNKTTALPLRFSIGCVTLLAGLVAAASGCAAVKATQQPEKKDLQVLAQGVPRTHVIAEFGTPVWSENRDGDTVDVFAFKQGYRKTTKAARALVHGAADVATFGLWEVVGIPAETLIDGTDVQLEVHYGPQQTVEHVVVIKGDKAVHPRSLFAGRKRPPAAAAETSIAGKSAGQHSGQRTGEIRQARADSTLDEVPPGAGESGDDR